MAKVRVYVSDRTASPMRSDRESVRSRRDLRDPQPDQSAGVKRRSFYAYGVTHVDFKIRATTLSQMPQTQGEKGTLPVR